MQTFKNLPLLAACAVGLMMSAANPGFTQEGTSPILAFEDIDTDKDAAISASEALAHQNAAFAIFDENKDGSLMVTEFLSTRLGAASLGFFAPRTFDLKAEHFELWNRNGDDVLSEVEFAAGGLAAFAEHDTNGDSRLDETEFLARLAQ